MTGALRSEASLLGGLGFSCAGALCSAAYLFPYKHASLFAPPPVLAFGLLLVAAVLNTALAALSRYRSSRSRSSLETTLARRGRPPRDGRG